MSEQELPGEQVLIKRARQGSVEAFEKLVLHYQDRLYRFLLVRAVSHADAEDALQEAFVSVLKYLPSYRSRYRFSTWLFTIAIRQLKKQSKLASGKVDLYETLECTLPGPEQIGIQSQQQQSLWQTAKACLSEGQFIALWLFYVEDMSLAEIGKTMKRPPSWVKVNLMRARRRLLRELEAVKPAANKRECAVSPGEVTL